MRTRSLAKMFSILFVFCAAMAVASPAQTLTTLVNFNYTNGAEPLYESLVQGADGNFYGTTNGAGAHNGGIVFKMTPSGTVTVLYSFCSQPNCTDGNAPDAGLALGSDGNFYGVTTSGGASGDGTVFKITPSGEFTLLHSFMGSDGAEPNGTLLLASDGNFYGTTTSQGSNHGGTLFRITSSGAFTTIYNFCSLGACHDGSGPFGGLMQGTDGYLYGTTTQRRHRLPLRHGVQDDLERRADHAAQLRRIRWLDAPGKAGPGQRWKLLWHDNVGWQHPSLYLRLRHDFQDHLKWHLHAAAQLRRHGWHPS